MSNVITPVIWRLDKLRCGFFEDVSPDIRSLLLPVGSNPSGEIVFSHKDKHGNHQLQLLLLLHFQETNIADAASCQVASLLLSFLYQGLNCKACQREHVKTNNSFLVRREWAASAHIMSRVHFMKCGSLFPWIVDVLNGQTSVEMLD